MPGSAALPDTFLLSQVIAALKDLPQTCLSRTELDTCWAKGDAHRAAQFGQHA